MAAADGSSRPPSPSEGPFEGLVRKSGWVVMCPLGQICGKNCKRLGWYESKPEAEERVISHLLDPNINHGEEVTTERAAELCEDPEIFYEEDRHFDQDGNVVHNPGWQKGKKGKGKGKIKKGKSKSESPGRRSRSRSRRQRRSRDRSRGRSRDRRRTRSRGRSRRRSRSRQQAIVPRTAAVTAAGRMMAEVMQGPPPPNLTAVVEATWQTYIPTDLHTRYVSHVRVCVCVCVCVCFLQAFFEN